MLHNIRVLHVFADPAHGVFNVAHLAAYQAKLGYNVEFACGEGEYLEKLTDFGFKVINIPFSRRILSLYHIISFFKIYNLLKFNSYHIVHTHTPTASFITRIASYFAHVPIVISHMRTSWWDSPNYVKRVLFTMFEFIAGFFTSHIFTINESDTNDIISKKIKRSSDVTCLHCGSIGIDTNYFRSDLVSKFQKESLKQEFRIKSSDIVIGFIGRIVAEKGVIELLKAFCEVHAIKPNTKLILCGGVLSSERDHKAANKVQEIISECIIKNGVIQTGFRNDIRLLLSIMDIVVLPSYREGFGTVLAEASSMGIPVISTATRGGKEAVIHGVNGFLVPIGDYRGLRNAILRLIDDPMIRKKMGINGCNIAIERFEQSLILKKLQAVYDRLLKENDII